MAIMLFSGLEADFPLKEFFFKNAMVKIMEKNNVEQNQVTKDVITST